MTPLSAPSDGRLLALVGDARFPERYKPILVEFFAAYRAALAEAGLPSLPLQRPIVSLSGGERTRVAMSRLLIEAPDLDAAIGWAKKIPGGPNYAIEVRPIHPM